jgi:hypothetical protein
MRIWRLGFARAQARTDCARRLGDGQRLVGMSVVVVLLHVRDIVEDRSIRLAQGVQQGLASSHGRLPSQPRGDRTRFTKRCRINSTSTALGPVPEMARPSQLPTLPPEMWSRHTRAPPIHAVARPARLGDLPRAAFAASLAAAMLDRLSCRTASSPLSCLRVELLSRPGTATRLTPRVPWTLRNGPLKSGRHASTRIREHRGTLPSLPESARLLSSRCHSCGAAACSRVMYSYP